MKYPKEYLNEIKMRLKVSQVVGKYIQLKKRGKEFIGLSPFKNEKTPSFTVSDEKEFYHCFSTGEHGNIFDFVMKTKSIGFGEAVKMLAIEAGIQPYRFSNFDEKKEKRFQTYKNIFEEYKKNAHNELFNEINHDALNYLKKRKLDIKIIKEFKLGYVPWQSKFYDSLIKKFSEDEINSTGLFYKNEKTNRFIDRFNSRIIFPVNDLSGNTIAFGGRIIKEIKLAKYINSPETEFYKKGNIVFNLDNAKTTRLNQDEVIIVEGYMDVVSLYSSGIKNIISNSGTALTERQIELIWKFFPNPILCLDGDESGQKAALRIAERVFPLINERNKMFFSILPNNEDPDDFIKKNSKEKFVNFLKDKKIIQDYIWSQYAKNININDPYAISKFEKEIKRMCYQVKDEVIKKYILEDFLKKIKELTPIQSRNNQFKNYNKFKKNKDFKILKETTKLYNQKNVYSKEQLKEFSILYILLNNQQASEKIIKEVEDLKFSYELNEKLKNEIISKIPFDQNNLKNLLLSDSEFKDLVLEIEKNASIVSLVKKEDNEIREILEELLQELKEMNHMKKIDFLEKKMAKNLDENSFSELIKLKNQINRE